MKECSAYYHYRILFTPKNIISSRPRLAIDERKVDIGNSSS